MLMSPRQRSALLAATAAFERELLFSRREAVAFDPQRHTSMHSFSKAFSKRFGELCVRKESTLLLHSGASLVDRRDALGLPLQAVGLSGPRCVLLLRLLGPHRLCGAPGPALQHVHRVAETAVGRVLLEPWPEATAAAAATQDPST